HGFVHDGDSLHYSPLTVTGQTMAGDEEFHRRLADIGSAYLSLPQELEDFLPALGLAETPLTRVGHCYDFLNGYHQRSLFYSSLATPKDFRPSIPSTTGEVPFVLQHFSGDETHNAALASQAHVAAFLHMPEALAFEVQKDQDVREWVSVPEFAGKRHHSILLFGGAPPSSSSRMLSTSWVLVSALLRAGFSHVIMSQEPLDAQTAAQFLHRYLTHLDTLPPDEAVAAAS